MVFFSFRQHTVQKIAEQCEATLALKRARWSASVRGETLGCQQNVDQGDGTPWEETIADALSTNYSSERIHEIAWSQAREVNLSD